MHIVKCRVCHKNIDTDAQNDWVKPEARMYYHKSCYEDFAKKKTAIKNGDYNIYADDDMWYTAVIDYLRKDLKITVNFPKLKKQWDDYIKKGFTAKGIYFCLRYFYEVAKGDPIKSEGGIGIIPHIYQDGAEYWGARNQRDHGICDRIASQIKQSENINIKVIKQKPKVKKKPAIDLSIIADMEDEE